MVGLIGGRAGAEGTPALFYDAETLAALEQAKLCVAHQQKVSKCATSCRRSSEVSLRPVLRSSPTQAEIVCPMPEEGAPSGSAPAMMTRLKAQPPRPPMAASDTYSTKKDSGLRFGQLVEEEWRLQRHSEATDAFNGW